MTLRLLVPLALALVGGCARNYRLDDSSVHVPRAPVAALRPLWQRPLVQRQFMDYKPQEWASPLVHRGVVYAGSSAGLFSAYAAADGRLLWTLKTAGGISSQPLIDPAGKTVFFGADDGKMYGVDTTTGKVRWTYATQGTINRAAALSEGFLLFTSNESRIYGLEAQTGKWRWQYDREYPEGFTIQGYAGVAVRGGTAFTGFADGTLVALRVFSGDVVWTRALGGSKAQFVDVDTTPVVFGDQLLTASYSGGVHAIVADTGSIRWQYPVEGATGILVHEGRIFVSAPKIGIVALDPTGRMLWRQAMREGVPVPPVARGPHLYVAGTESGIFVVSAATGRLLQSFDPGHGISAPPGVGAGYLATLTNQGVLYVFRVGAGG